MPPSPVARRMGPKMNRVLIASVFALLVMGSAAQASMSLASRQAVQPASAPTSSATTIPTTPSDAGKASAPVAPSAVTKPTVDTPRAVSTTDRSAARKRGKTEQAENRDERGEDSTPNKARRAQRTPDESKGDDDDARPSRKRGLEKIERILGLMHGMRPNFFARWR
jgi:hypothetical protein